MQVDHMMVLPQQTMCKLILLFQSKPWVCPGVYVYSSMVFWW